jgi:hypothetical protein
MLCNAKYSRISAWRQHWQPVKSQQPAARASGQHAYTDVNVVGTDRLFGTTEAIRTSAGRSTYPPSQYGQR